MGVDFKDMSDFLSNVEKLKADIPKIAEDSAKDITARFYTKVIKRTPVGRMPDGLSESAKEHWNGYVGGTLRRAWTISDVKLSGKVFTCEVVNTAPYSSYVEYGHRQKAGKFIPALGVKLKNGFVPGQYMMTQSLKEIEQIAPLVLQKRVQKELERYMNGK